MSRRHPRCSMSSPERHLAAARGYRASLTEGEEMSPQQVAWQKLHLVDRVLTMARTVQRDAEERIIRMEATQAALIAELEEMG